MLVFLLFVLFNSVNGWNWNNNNNNPQLTSCNIIIDKELNHFEEPKIGNEWNYNDISNNIQNNMACGVIYINSNKIVLIDQNRDDDDEFIRNNNLHIIKTTPQITEDIITLFKKHKINFSVEEYYPSPAWYFWVLYYAFKVFVGLIYINLFHISIKLFIHLYNRDNIDIDNNIKLYKQDNKDEPTSDITFDDVAGCDEAKYELQEIVDFLKDPESFKNAGAKIPSGVLLEGPPGTGKTMLAKATSNEAEVNFISANGSQFIEVYVGVGASRVRKLFEKAKKNKPCIIFIDEIDAVGRSRSNGAGGNSEQDQTINQLLTNMDGFDTNDGIIVMAATNRADMLDKALVRNGRFDRKITVGLPDKVGREQIIDVHLKDKEIDKNIDMNMIYELTTGFTGAQLANLINEACILSVRYKLHKISEKCLLDAFEKITIGLPKTVDNRPKENIEMVAYHEAGHTIGALYFNEMFDVRRVTINANNTGAGGYTLFTPKEKFVHFPTKRFMLANIIICLGGRAGEILLFRNKNPTVFSSDKFIFNDHEDLNITTGASNDLKQAYDMAREYIATYGLGNHIGLYDSDGTNNSFHSKLSERSKKRIDKEIEEMINVSLTTMIAIIENNMDQLTIIADSLMNFKTINGELLEEKVNIIFE